MEYRTAIRDLPLVIRRLRQRAGHKTQRAALRQIRRKTGVSITPTRLSEWERGRSMPAFPSIIAFLTGLGYDFTDLQRDLELVAGETPAPAAESKPLRPVEARTESKPRPVKAGTLARARRKTEGREERWAREDRELQEDRRWLDQYKKDNNLE